MAGVKSLNYKAGYATKHNFSENRLEFEVLDSENINTFLEF